MNFLFALMFLLAPVSPKVNATHPEGVIHIFPSGFSKRAEKLRNAVSSPVSDAEVLRLAQDYLLQGRASRDGRCINLALSLLEPFLTKENARAEALITASQCMSYKHDFPAALEFLNRSLLIAKSHEAALIEKASILVTLGHYQEVKTLFARNPSVLSTSRGIVLISLVASLTGQLQAAYDLLRRQLETRPPATSEELSWTQGIAAEMAERLGRPAEAEALYREALGLKPASLYLSNAWADFLLDQDRSQEALDFIAHSGHREKLLLRKVIARPTPVEIAILENEFSRSTAHRREHSLFLLKVKQNPTAALNVALLNWETQKEAIDARLVLESAARAQHMTAAQPILAWLKENKFEDARLAHFWQKDALSIVE